jgi:hypothetical protein
MAGLAGMMGQGLAWMNSRPRSRKVRALGVLATPELDWQTVSWICRKNTEWLKVGASISKSLSTESKLSVES